jgi:hypothetical protein
MQELYRSRVEDSKSRVSRFVRNGRLHAGKFMPAMNSMFKDHHATAAERTAIEESVSKATTDDVEKITFLLCNLSTAERALMLFSPAKLDSQIHMAQHVIRLQTPLSITSGNDEDMAPYRYVLRFSLLNGDLIRILVPMQAAR